MYRENQKSWSDDSRSNDNMSDNESEDNNSEDFVHGLASGPLTKGHAGATLQEYFSRIKVAVKRKGSKKSTKGP
eukprot:13406571-Ditylum_brightwellii.AAC.1